MSKSNTKMNNTIKDLDTKSNKSKIYKRIKKPKEIKKNKMI